MLYVLELIGVASFAITGCLRMREKKLDLLGMLVIAFVTALGGGTLRDLLLDIDPIFWMRDTTYIWVALAAALFTFFVARHIAFPMRLLLITDALGLAVAAIMGVQTALNNGADAAIAVMMGMVSGTAGGVVRDILSNEIPFIFGSELYATAAAAGSGVFMVLVWFAEVPFEWAAIAGITTVLVLRLAALRYKIMLPTFETRQPS
jgi:uncharacterized membrane protein YeiH